MSNLLKALDEDIFYGQFDGLVGSQELKKAFIEYLEANRDSVSINEFDTGNIFISSNLEYESKNICKARKLLWFRGKEGNCLEKFKQYIADSGNKGYKFISTALSTGSYAKNNMLSELGFKYVNTKLLFSKEIKQIKKADKSIYRLEDTDFGYLQLKKIMRNAFKYSRFYNDRNISKKIADNLYTDWLKALIAKNHDIYVSVKEKEVAGFMVVDANHAPKFSSMKYGLMYFVLVDRKFLNQQVGTNLLHFAEWQMLKMNIRYFLTNTQVTNLPAVKFYIKNGFYIHNSVNEYHWWGR